MQPRYSNIQIARVISEGIEPAYQMTTESFYLGNKRGSGADPVLVAPEAIQQGLDETFAGVS